MADKPIIMLQGDTLFMDCIAVRLQKNTVFEVKRAGELKLPLQPEKENSPAVVLFDFDRPELGALYDCMAQKPGPLVFGFSMTQNTVVQLSGEPWTPATIDELQAIIVRELNFQEGS